jgi:hypothetical protein
MFNGTIKIPFDVRSTRMEIQEHKITRGIGIKKEVRINNLSGKKAWVIISPTPILQLGSLGLDKLGQISFNYSGEYKCQQSPIANGTSRTFELDTIAISYSVFFYLEDEKKWKVHFKDKKHDTSSKDINLLDRHVEEAVDVEFNIV